MGTRSIIPCHFRSWVRGHHHDTDGLIVQFHVGFILRSHYTGSMLRAFPKILALICTMLAQTALADRDCGPEFAALFHVAASQHDPALCFRATLPLQFAPEADGSGALMCTAPARPLAHPPKHAPQWTQAYGAIYQDSIPATCVAALAIFANETKICRALKARRALQLFHGLSLDPWRNCLLEVVALHGDPAPCRDIPASTAAAQDRYQCFKLASWASGDRGLCENIPTTETSLRAACRRE